MTSLDALRTVVAVLLASTVAWLVTTAQGQAPRPTSIDVDAGVDRPVSLDDVARLDGAFRLLPEGSDVDGEPRVRWRALDGPGPVLFAKETRLAGAEVAFLEPGLYRIELDVEIDGLRGTDVVTLQVVDGPVYGRTAYPADDYYASVRAFP